jgi:hypothetical protein
MGFVVAGVDDPGTALWFSLPRSTPAATAYLSFPKTAQWFPIFLAYSTGSVSRDDRPDL